MKQLLTLSLFFLGLTLALTITLVMAPATSAEAQDGFQGPSGPAVGGGFTGPGLATATVTEALRQRDDSYVILQGQIVRHLGKDKYLFKDATGEINLDIDNNKWNGLNVTPDDTVEIRGEIDKDWNSIEVDVDSISKVG
ncbi:MAG: YgiW/YdeI family stress tolerance OB fold protein [Deltaproteobacteria bacterium]|nr:YgiW/YdeI family stress tolerance OB fold protein [Deltaproteobacteria bacterium]